MPLTSGCMCDGTPCTSDCRNKPELCQLEITGNLSTLRCTRFPRNIDLENNNENFNNNNNVQNNNTNPNSFVSNQFSRDMMAQTTCVRYVDSVASIRNGITPVFYSKISRNNRPCIDNELNNF